MADNKIHLASDSQGFLVGEAVSLDSLVVFWRQISTDTKAIRQAVTQLVQNAQKKTRTTAQTVSRTRQRKESTKDTVRATSQRQAQERTRQTSARPTVSRPQTRVTQQGEIQAAPRATAVRSTRTVRPNTQENTAASTVPAQTTARARARARRPVEPASPTQRDARGRFQRRNSEQGPQGETRTAREMRRGLADIAHRVEQASAAAGQDMGQVDPTVQAMGEVVQPFARGLEFITGGHSPEESWLRRIFRTMHVFRRQETAYEKVQARTLKNIEKKSDTASSGGGMSGLLHLVGSLFLFLRTQLGSVLKALGFAKAAAVMRPPMPVPEGTVGTGPGSGKKAGKTSRLGGLLKGTARRLPWIGAILGALGLYGDVAGAVDAPGTQADKDRAVGGAVGRFAGGLGGMWGGAAAGAALGSLAGPIGTAIGGVVGGAAGAFFGDKAGEILGQKVGEWTTSLREADIPGKISAAWSATTTAIQAKWDSVSGSVAATFAGAQKWLDKQVSSFDAWLKDNGIDVGAMVDKAKQTGKELLTAANDKIKEKTGVDVAATLEKAGNYVGEKYQATKATVGDGVDKVKGFFAGNKGQTVAGVRVGPQQQAKAPDRNSSRITDWYLGATSKREESGRSGAGTVSSGVGDAGGVSYGTYQFASANGSVDRFLQATGYDKQFAGLKPGSKEFSDRWKEVAANDPAFGQVQHDYVKSQYYDKAMSALQREGIDLSGHGRAVQDAVWSTAVQFGAGGNSTSRGAVGMIRQALQGKDARTMSDAEIVSALQDYKIQNNDKLFRSSSAAVRLGTLGRAQREKEDLLHLAAAPTPILPQIAPPQVRQAAVAPSVAVPAVPTLAKTAPNAAVASVPMPLGSLKDRAPVSVQIENEVGQDLRDRRIAHIVTGGLSDN